MKALVVGAGAISRQHLGALSQIPAVGEVHVCDLSEATARAMWERFTLTDWTTDFHSALREVRPDVVHVTTPPASHHAIARASLEAGCHVIVEKPATLEPHRLTELVDLAEQRGLVLVEDYNYLFNPCVLEALSALDGGTYGDLVHVDVSLSLDIYADGSAYLDPATNGSFRQMRGGPIADFLPHLASLAHRFVGAHTRVHTVWSRRDPTLCFPDGFRALIESRTATASIGFSARAQPDLFSVSIEGTSGRSRINVFEGRSVHERRTTLARPLVPLVNGLRESRDVGAGSLFALSRKLSGGPGAYQGLWTLLQRFYAAISTGTPPPVSTSQMREVSALVEALGVGSSEQ